MIFSFLPKTLQNKPPSFLLERRLQRAKRVTKGGGVHDIRAVLATSEASRKGVVHMALLVASLLLPPSSFAPHLDNVLQDAFRHRSHREVHYLAFFVDENSGDGFDAGQIYYVR